jgi:hypothetical protein
MDKLMQLIGIVLLFFGRSERFYRKLSQEVGQVIYDQHSTALPAGNKEKVTSIP